MVIRGDRLAPLLKVRSLGIPLIFENSCPCLVPQKWGQYKLSNVVALRTTHLSQFDDVRVRQFLECFHLSECSCFFPRFEFLLHSERQTCSLPISLEYGDETYFTSTADHVRKLLASASREHACDKCDAVCKKLQFRGRKNSNSETVSHQGPCRCV